MLYLIFILGLVGSAFALSSENTYQLNLEVKMDGELVNFPNQTVKEGKKTTLVQTHKGKTVHIDILAKEKEILADERATVEMDFTLSEVLPNGTKTILSNPKIITIENEEAQVSMSNQQGKEEYSVTVTPQIIIE